MYAMETSRESWQWGAIPMDETGSFGRRAAGGDWRHEPGTIYLGRLSLCRPVAGHHGPGERHSPHMQLLPASREGCQAL